VKQVDYDITNPGEISIEALCGGILAESVFENGPEEVRNRAQVGGVDADGAEGPTGQVELITQSHIHVRHIVFRGLLAGPLCQGFKELFCRN
jgi:hypothetical protein